MLMSSPLIDTASTQTARAPRACDACRLRKTRCDVKVNESDSPCVRCRRLQLQCTFELTVGRRGPKRKRIQDDVVPTPTTTSIDASAMTFLSPTSFGNSPQSTFPTDGICSRALLRSVVDDFLNCIYPLIPIVHRPSFCFDLDENRDMNDNDFLGLVVAIFALVVALLPSRFEGYRSRESEHVMAQSRAEVLDRCYDFLTTLRGPDFFEQIGFNKWAASYLMAIAFFQVGKHNRARMIEVESMQLGRLLDLHRIDEYRDLDCIETQLRKKGFWLLFYGYVHSEVQNFRKEKLSFLDHAAMETTNLKALMPFEVEDEQIFKHHVVLPSMSDVTLTKGFIIHSRIFWQALEDPHIKNRTECLCCRTRSPAAQVAHLESRLKELKYALDDAPMPFRQWALPYIKSAESTISPSQLATLRANIHVTNLWLQSMLLDQLDLLTSPEQHWHDREVISTQLLHVLHTTAQEDIEPNGLHLVYKVRDVAVGLLACPFTPPDPSAKRAQEYVREFTDIMAHLDASETVNTANLQSWTDTGRQLV